MGTNSLNLSRKWRSRNFDQIVGQNLVVRILKNSLYSARYFPVYLFVGQRGCGKTSTARIFAAALNCTQLEEFQKNPKTVSVPCLACESCTAMMDGSHPDFIEIDAASHTGVDNMRNIIEASSLLPVMGSKRIYLIDEAHMLSKAACNAALKILEEPPASAIFILATTNPHKIIDTVRSRCFTLFFSRIEHNLLKNHLEQLCKAESIRYESDGIESIVRQSDGSARDALNLLERVRFSHPIVNKQAVSSLLGHLGDRELVAIIDVLLTGTAHDVLQVLKQIAVENYSAEFVWQRLMVVLRACIWAKHGLSVEKLVSCGDEVVQCVSQTSLAHLMRIAQHLYAQEDIFNKTTMQHVVLEMILLSCLEQEEISVKKKVVISESPRVTKHSVPVTEPAPVIQQQEKKIASAESSQAVENNQGMAPEISPVPATEWQLFIAKITALQHTILPALFKKASFIQHDTEKQVVCVEFSKDMMLFEEWITREQAVWLPLLQESFGATVKLTYTFSAKAVAQEPFKAAASVEKNGIQRPAGVVKKEEAMPKKKVFSRPVTSREAVVDISNTNEWKMATMLTSYFPGTITEIREQL